MNKQTLVELALDLRWSWNQAADELWQQLDPALWALTNNSWVILQTISNERLEQMLADPGFRQKLDNLLRTRETFDSAPSWYHQHYANEPVSAVAYFSMEYMLSEALPIYVGGLGNVAGDQLKSANDLGVPVVAIGLLYQQGYFRQDIDINGNQLAFYPYNDPGQLPIRPLLRPNGEWLRLRLSMPGHDIWLRTWEVQVGRARLYLLDSNDPANLPVHRGITSQIYGGGMDLRIKQEMILGIGGWQLLRELNVRPEVCHLNEGHAAFAILERARSFMEETGKNFEEALAVTRAGNLFTTHTAVAAGFDHFSPDLVYLHLNDYATNQLKISFDRLMSLGRSNGYDKSESFNMAYLAIHGACGVNGVSALHGEVSRHLFEPAFYRWPTHEVPVGHVTNGVHVPSWESSFACELWQEACGKDRWLFEVEGLGEDINRISDEKLWDMRNRSRQALVRYTRERMEMQLATRGESPETLNRIRQLFDPNVLTLGFARRFVSYKRPNLLLRDPERLIRLLTNPEKKVQLLMAGKAPPTDGGGTALIQQWIQFIRRPEVRDHVVFLSDYDMLLAEHLVQGVDVWLNTPRRPWEASGTSGMKVLVNGGLNLSELDGWWVEAYTPEVGWALGDGKEHGEDPSVDAAEAEALFALLEHQVVPEFYSRDAAGIPRSWVTRIRRSMSTLTPRFSANRTVREYTESYYLPAARRYRQRAANNGAAGTQIAQWQHQLDQQWSSIGLGDLKAEVQNDQYLLEIPVHLPGVPPEWVQVELIADALGGRAGLRQAMDRSGEAGDQTYIYRALTPANRPLPEITVRVIPFYPDVEVPLEFARVTWQR